MPELPYTTWKAKLSPRTLVAQYSGSEGSAVMRPHQQSLSSFPEILSLGAPTESPTVADMGEPPLSCASSHTGDDDDEEIVDGKPHAQQPVVELADILESGRTFSDLSDPAAIRSICLLKIPTWTAAKLSAPQVQVSQIMAGLTNQLFRVYLPDNVAPGIIPRQVLLRVYGTTVGDLYDPSFELEVFKVLSKHESAPKLIAEFPGGRIEEYILGPALLVRDMRNPAVVCAMASILGKFHKLDSKVPEIANWRKSEPAAWRFLDRWSSKAWSLYQVARSTLSTNDCPDPSPTAIVRQASFNSVGSTECLIRDKARRLDTNGKKSLVSRLEDTGLVEMYRESHYLKRLILPPGSEHQTQITSIGFCHNDVQENNILVTGTRLRLIDFEYADFNFPAFDIANFFCEMTIDYCVNQFPFFTHQTAVEMFPSVELIRLFGSVYLSEHTGFCILPSDDSFLDPFVVAVQRFALVSHIVWGFWSIIRAPQAATSSDFDFLVYAKSRFQAYRLWKDHLLATGVLSKSDSAISTGLPLEIAS